MSVVCLHKVVFLKIKFRFLKKKFNKIIYLFFKNKLEFFHEILIKYIDFFIKGLKNLFLNNDLKLYLILSLIHSSCISSLVSGKILITFRPL